MYIWVGCLWNTWARPRTNIISIAGSVPTKHLIHSHDWIEDYKVIVCEHSNKEKQHVERPHHVVHKKNITLYLKNILLSGYRTRLQPAERCGGRDHGWAGAGSHGRLLRGDGRQPGAGGGAGQIPGYWSQLETFAKMEVSHSKGRPPLGPYEYVLLSMVS